MTDTRTRIAEYVHAHPGVHFNELTRSLDLANGQVQYHLKRLTREDVVAEQLYGKTHYYPPAFDDWERTALALLHRETASEIIVVLLTDGPMSPRAVAEELDIARSTLEWHLDRLVEQDVVEKRRDTYQRVELGVTHPDRIVTLLDEADPSIVQRLVDRFTRLVDDIVAEQR